MDMESAQKNRKCLKAMKQGVIELESNLEKGV